jgi:hypothetical protein
MSQVRPRIRGGARRSGGVLGYPLDQLYQEVAFVAYHFHWSVQEIASLEHPERRRWVKEISAINQRLESETNAT